MRQLVFLAAIPLALGCAQQSALRAPHPPTDEPLQVRLYEPSAGALNYTLSEPGYVAIFAVTQRHGVRLLYPYYESQIERQSPAGLNQETVHSGSVGWGYGASGQYEHRALIGHADAFYVIASKYPLPVEQMLQLQFLPRRLVGLDIARATSLTAVTEALEAILVSDLPNESWSSDIYLTWRDPFAVAYLEPRPYLEYCNGRFGLFYASALFGTGSCGANIRNTTATPPIQIVEVPRRAPPNKPLDRDPAVPLPPEPGIARASRSGNAAMGSERTRRDADSGPVAIARPAPAAREQPSTPSPSRPAESSPQPQPSPDRGDRPQPQPG